MKCYKIILLIYFFLASYAWSESVIVEGIIIGLKPTFDLDSQVLQNEYVGYDKNQFLDSHESNFFAMEILVKIDVGIFNKYCIIIEDHNILTIKSNMINEDAIETFYMNNEILNNQNRTIENFSELIEIINLQIENMKIVLLENYQWDEIWVVYNVIDYKVFNDNIYLIIGFEDSHNALGAILFVLNYSGEILEKVMLTEDIFKPMFSLYFSRILSADEMILFLPEGPESLDTKISVVPINVN